MGQSSCQLAGSGPAFAWQAEPGNATQRCGFTTTNMFDLVTIIPYMRRRVYRNLAIRRANSLPSFMASVHIFRRWSTGRAQASPPGTRRGKAGSLPASSHPARRPMPTITPAEFRTCRRDISFVFISKITFDPRRKRQLVLPLHVWDGPRENLLHHLAGYRSCSGLHSRIRLGPRNPRQS